MKPEYLKYFQNFIIDLHLFTPVVRLAIFLKPCLRLHFFILNIVNSDSMIYNTVSKSITEY